MLKLFWFNIKTNGTDREWEMGCLWPVFLILAAVVALIWWLV